MGSDWTTIQVKCPPRTQLVDLICHAPHLRGHALQETSTQVPPEAPPKDWLLGWKQHSLVVAPFPRFFVVGNLRADGTTNITKPPFSSSSPVKRSANQLRSHGWEQATSKEGKAAFLLHARIKGSLHLRPTLPGTGRGRSSPLTGG